MLSDSAGQSADGVGSDTDEASGGSNAAALVEVLKHGQGLRLGELAVTEGRARALGEAVVAGLAGEQADVVLLAGAGADREIAGVAAGVEGAVGVLRAAARAVVQAENRSEQRGSDEVQGSRPGVAPILRCSPAHGSIILRHDPKIGALSKDYECYDGCKHLIRNKLRLRQSLCSDDCQTPRPPWPSAFGSTGNTPSAWS
jgi:hypothetical protein